jgi:hypothetical protein
MAEAFSEKQGSPGMAAVAGAFGEKLKQHPHDEL